MAESVSTIVPEKQNQKGPASQLVAILSTIQVTSAHQHPTPPLQNLSSTAQSQRKVPNACALTFTISILEHQWTATNI